MNSKIVIFGIHLHIYHYNMLRNIYLIIILLASGLFSSLYAKNQEAVTLSPEDSTIRVEVVRIIREANVHNGNRDFDEAIELYKIADSLAESIDDLVLQASSNYNSGLCYYKIGKYIPCRDYLEKAVFLSQSSNDSINYPQYLLGLGILYKTQGDYNNAAKFIIQALTTFEKNGNLKLMGSAYNSLAGIQKKLDNDSLAVEYYLSGKEIHIKLKDSILIAISDNNLGYFYLERGDVRKAKLYLNKSLAIKLHYDDKTSIANTMNNLGEVYHQLGMLDSASYYYHKALTNAYLSNTELSTISISNSLAKLYLDTRDYSRALTYLSKTRPIAKLNSKNDLLLENYKLSSQVYTKLNDYIKAYSFLELYIKLNSEMFNIEKTKGINELQFQYDTEKKDLTIQNLNEVNIIKSKSLKIRNTSLIVISIVLFLSFILAMFLFHAYKAKRKALDQVQLLMREKQHRTKNNLQLLSSVLSLQSLKADDENRNMALAGEHRVQSIVLLDKLLSNDSQSDQVEVKTYIQNLVEGLKEAYDHQNRITFDLQLDSFLLAAPQATHLGLIINELITNSLKYAFINYDNPIIKVTCQKDEENHCRLSIKDNGPGLSKEFNLATTSSLGLKLVKTMSKQLKGKYEIKGDDGFEFQLNFKLKYQG